VAVRNLADSLLDASLLLASELSLPVVLQRIVELATKLTGARYGALGVLGPDRRITEFVTIGLSGEERTAIGDLPKGHGILGLLIEDPRPLRLAEIAAHERSVGFPANHPPMRSFLGAPVMAHERVFGNIYLTEKQGEAEFTEDDERLLVHFARQAGLAVENAYLYEETVRRERWMEALRDITVAILQNAPTQDVLRLIAVSARDLVNADVATIATPGVQGPPLMIRIAEGAHADELRGQPVPLEGSITGEVIRTRKAVVLDDVSRSERAFQPIARLGDIGPAIFVPLVAGGEAFGTLQVANVRGRPRFGSDQRALVETFAQQASLALEYARAQRDLQRLAVMEDRERIAKELHDGAIQSLFAVGMGLQATSTVLREEQTRARIARAVDEIDGVIEDLRNYIFGLRPGILTSRELEQALHALANDFEMKTAVAMVVDVDSRVATQLEPHAGEVVQLAREALSNVGRHAEARTCRLSLRRAGEGAALEIDDDGKGFDASAVREGGQGLRNIRDRAARLGGTVQLESSPAGGTTLRVLLPV
jgi:signal transduction histidine kinase